MSTGRSAEPHHDDLNYSMITVAVLWYFRIVLPVAHGSCPNPRVREYGGQARRTR